MWTPVTAVLWESWRLTCRRLLLITAVAALCGWLLLRSSPGRSAAFLVYFVLCSLAVAMALSMPTIGIRAGFPFSRAFSRPIRTSVLVAVPLAYVCAACAASYLVPAAVLRAFTGVPFPLMPVATLIGALAAIVAGSSWFTRNTTARLVAAIVAFIGTGWMLRLLRPFSEAGPVSPPAVPEVGPQLCVLSGIDYLTVVLLIGGIYIWICRASSGNATVTTNGLRARAPIDRLRVERTSWKGFEIRASRCCTGVVRSRPQRRQSYGSNCSLTESRCW